MLWRVPHGTLHNMTGKLVAVLFNTEWFLLNHDRRNVDGNLQNNWYTNFTSTFVILVVSITAIDFRRGLGFYFSRHGLIPVEKG
jgi:hypothetical protein